MALSMAISATGDAKPLRVRLRQQQLLYKTYTQAKIELVPDIGSKVSNCSSGFAMLWRPNSRFGLLMLSQAWLEIILPSRWMFYVDRIGGVDWWARKTRKWWQLEMSWLLPIKRNTSSAFQACNNFCPAGCSAQRHVTVGIFPECLMEANIGFGEMVPTKTLYLGRSSLRYNGG